jgi:ABC-type lipoprotein export system ATPase subunit
VSAPIVELHDVFCVHRTSEGDAAALQGTTLELARGELLCVLGPSGAGKSTLLRVIAGLESPSAGVVRVLGSDIGRLPERARARVRHSTLGFLTQHAELALPPDLTVRRAIALPLMLRAVGPADRQARVEALLDAAALSDRGNALPSELSGGERQRIALCVALAHRPALLLADEPTGELDDASARTVRALIVELARAHGASVVVVSHDSGSAELADRTVRMRDGRIAEDHSDGERALVVDRGGWLRLPSELLTGAGIGSRANVRAVIGGLMVTPVGNGAETAVSAGNSGAPVAETNHRPWAPSRVALRDVQRARGQGAGLRQVIDGLTLDIEAGRMTVIAGRSGVGKTTLLRMLSGIDRPDGGELLIDDVPLARMDAEQLAGVRRARIGYLPQEPSPVGFLSAEENVVLALRLRGWSVQDAAAHATAVLARVGLADRARQRVSRLSAGEAQRVALARALAGARGLLIVDEPTSRLDEANAAAVAELLSLAASSDGHTVVCATHDPEVIRRADEVVALEG